MSYLNHTCKLCLPTAVTMFADSRYNVCRQPLQCLSTAVTMEPLFDELQCPVCLELYNCPVILPCSHILCRSPCAERLINHGFVRCPVCRDNSYISEGVQTLPRVISLENIINRLKHPRTDADVCRPGDVPCQLCQQVL